MEAIQECGMTEAKRRYQREWRKKHPGYMRAWMRKWRAVPENKAKERLRPWYGARRVGF